MHDPVQNSWIAKRNRSIERLIKAWINGECPTGGGEEPTITAAGSHHIQPE
jgi:hypothetical protein